MLLAIFAMAAAALAVMVGLPIFLAIILTRRSGTLEVKHVTRRLVPLGPDDEALLGGAVYRGGHGVAGREVTEVHIEQQPLEVLPLIVRYAAGWCRASFCLAALFGLPWVGGLLIDLDSEPGPLGLCITLGIPGFALSLAHAFTRAAMLSASPRAPVLANVVGALTVGYGLATVGCVVWIVSSPAPSQSTWSLLDLDSAGSMVALLLALTWMVLGVALVVSGNRLRVWRQQLPAGS